MAGFFGMKEDRPLTLEEMYGPRIEHKTNYRLYVYLVSLILGISVLMVGLMNQFGVLNIAGANMTDFLVLMCLILIGPYGFVETSRFNKIKSLETKLPEFLRDVAEAGKFGMTLAIAIRTAAKGKYGDLTPEIKRMAAQIGWGISATEALRLFSERVDTPLIRRTCGIIIKAANAGGNVADILTLVSNEIKDAQLEQAEKELNMSAFTIVIYVAFFVFLATVLILNSVFLPQIAAAGGKAGGEQVSAGGVATVNAQLIPEVRFIYLASALVHGLGDGVTAGILQNGQIPNGLRHSFIMILMSFVMLRMLLV